MSGDGPSGSRRPARLAADVDLPAPNLQRAFLFAGLAAVAGSLVWGAIAYFAQAEHGLVAWGIGGVVGLACVLGGGHGRTAAVLAGALALASIASGKLFAYRLVVDDIVAGAATAEVHAEMREDSRLWHELGTQPTDEQIATFGRERGYGEVDPREFLDEQAPILVRFHEQQPSLEDWRESMRGQFTEQFTFAAYLAEDFHGLDIVFAILGIGTAFGLVQRRTAEMHRAAVAARRRREETAEAQADHAAREAAAEDPSGDERGQEVGGERDTRARD